MENTPVTYEYIRGLIDGEGCFTFCNIGKPGLKKRVPTFTLAMNERDKRLIYLIKEKLNLRNTIYEYEPRVRKDRYKRGGMVILMVRDVGQLKNIIVPLCYKKLRGYKAVQFIKWIQDIYDDPRVPESYKFISKLYHWEFYDKITKFNQ